jgi:hypothetical protein
MVMKYRPKQDIQTIALNIIILKHYKTFKTTRITDLDSMIYDVIETGHFNNHSYQEIKDIIYLKMTILKNINFEEYEDIFKDTKSNNEKHNDDSLILLEYLVFVGFFIIVIFALLS